MYKWHVNSALGRGRPISNDIMRVTEGIASSLRQFSISAQRSANDSRYTLAPSNAQQLTSLDSNPPSRTERSAKAIAEVSSLAPAPAPSRGIDARSLAAKPPGQTFTITRVDNRSDAQLQRAPLNPTAGLVSRGPRPAGFAGRGGMGGAGRGGAGRGGARGRGGLRGRNARGPRAKKTKHAEEVDYEVLPYDEAEAAEYDEISGGVPAPYDPITSLESLRGWGPGVITSPQGIRESVTRSLAIGMDKKYPGWNDVAWHRRKLNETGYTMLKDEAERKSLRKSNWEPRVRGVSVPNAQREVLEKTWVAGHYDKPSAGVDRKDVLGLVGAYSRKNAAYLAEETKQFEGDVAKLLPASLKKAASTA